MWLALISLSVLIASVTLDKTVDLSHRHLKKEDFFVRLQTVINLQGVTELILRDNEFDSFLDCSTNLDNLKTLDLSQNHLQRFFFLCKDEYNLQTLNVSHNKLEYIDDNALNDRVSKLKILDLSYNKLTVVNETMLEHYKILEFLSVSHNPIYDGIHENAFWNLTALKHLDLSDISAPYFTPEFFRTLNNLTYLDLSRNPISTVPTLPTTLLKLDLSGTHVVQLHNLYLPQLRELRINNMQNLTLLSLNDLENLTSLETLSAVGCKRLIHFKVWPHDGPLLPRLQRLSVHNCALETLGPDLRPVVQRTAVIDLYNNPWRCDCRMQWVNSINDSKEISREIRCRTPDRHHDKLLGEIPNYELQCEYITSVFYPVMWTCMSILIVSLAILGVFYLLRRQLGHWGVRRRNRDTVTYANVVESSNDLVRILAVGENHERNDE